MLQAFAALCMTLALARWSTILLALPTSWQGADSAQRVGLAATFDALNSYLGNSIGEFVCERTR